MDLRDYPRHKNPAKTLQNRATKKEIEDQLILQYESGETIYWGETNIAKMNKAQILTALKYTSTQKGKAWREVFKREIKKRK